MSGEEILAQITAQGLVVRDLKVAKAEKDAITVEVKKLLALKVQYKDVTGEDVPGSKPSKKDKKKAKKPAAAPPQPKKKKEKKAPAPAKPAAAAAPAPAKAKAPA